MTDIPTLPIGQPEPVVDHPSQTGEGPLWHEEAAVLHWVDIPAGTLFRFDPETGQNTVAYQHSGAIGGYTIQADGSLLLFCEHGEILRLIGTETEPVITGIDAMRGSRFNDVIADPEGRVFAGTMPLADGAARLYRLDPDGSLTVVYDDLTLGNGMGFSPDLATFYVTDSNTRRIYAADYDRATGEPRNRRTLVQVEDEGTVPDGMTVDAEGTIWSARWDGRALYAYAPDGSPRGKVPFPVRKVSSVTFAGPGYDIAYVTTAGGKERSEHEGVLAGSLFRVDLGVTGRAPFRSRIGM